MAPQPDQNATTPSSPSSSGAPPNLEDRTIRVTEQDLAMFRELYLGTSELTGRMSELMWLDIYTPDATCGVSPHDTLRVIKELDGQGPKSGIEPAAPFKNAIERGSGISIIFPRTL